MMLYVLFYVCSVVNVGKCNQESIRVSENPLPPMACIKQAQPDLARWQMWHPNKRIEKFKCVDEERLNKEIERTL